MADCEGVPTGGNILKDAILGCSETFCINLADPATMDEFKRLLRSTVDAPVALDTPLWTERDEIALRLWYNRTDPDAPGMWGNEIDYVGGVAVPTGNTVMAMLSQLGYPTTSEPYRLFPKLAFACDAFRGSDCAVMYLEVGAPVLGELAPPGPPPSASDDTNPSGAAAKVGAMSTVEAVGYGLAGAFVVATVVMLWRGRR